MTYQCKVGDISFTTNSQGEILRSSNPAKVRELCTEGRDGFYIIGCASKQFGLYQITQYYSYFRNAQV